MVVDRATLKRDRKDECRCCMAEKICFAFATVFGADVRMQSGVADQGATRARAPPGLTTASPCGARCSLQDNRQT